MGVGFERKPTRKTAKLSPPPFLWGGGGGGLKGNPKETGISGRLNQRNSPPPPSKRRALSALGKPQRLKVGPFSWCHPRGLQLPSAILQKEQWIPVVPMVRHQPFSERSVPLVAYYAGNWTHWKKANGFEAKWKRCGLSQGRFFVWVGNQGMHSRTNHWGILGMDSFDVSVMRTRDSFFAEPPCLQPKPDTRIENSCRTFLEAIGQIPSNNKNNYLSTEHWLKQLPSKTKSFLVDVPSKTHGFSRK